MAVTVGEDRSKRARVAEAQHLGRCRIDVRVRDFPPLAVDEPVIAGGRDEGPSPLEYVTAGLAACKVVTVAKIAEAMGLRHGTLAARAEADVVFRAARTSMSPIPRFTAARIAIRLECDEEPERIEALKEMVRERCPASNLFLDAGIAPELTWTIVPMPRR